MNETSQAAPSAMGNSGLDAIDELPLPYLEMDARGYITRANRATQALHPKELGSLIGRMAWELIASDEMEQSCAAYLSLMESGVDPPRVLRHFYTRSGEYRTYELHRSLIRDAEGRPAGMRMLCVDVTQAQRVLEEAQRARMAGKHAGVGARRGHRNRCAGYHSRRESGRRRAAGVQGV